MVKLLNWVAAVILCATATTYGADGQQIRVGFFPNITHAQALYGKANGAFDKATGAKVAWTSFNAGPTAIESLFTDAIDMTYIGPGPAVNGFIKSRGEKFVVISGAASGGAGLVVRGDAGINSEKDFNNKKVATPQLGNTQDIAARVWFTGKKYKFKERGGTLTILPLANPDQLTMFQRKEIDGAWTIEPWLSRLEIEAGGKLLLDEKTLWPEGKYVTTHLIVSKAFLQKQPQLVQKFLTAHVEITQQISSNKTAAATILNEQLKKETGKALKPEVITKALERVEFTWDPISASLHKGAADAHEIGFLKTEPKLNGIYALDPLNTVLKQKNLPAVSAK
ncbi:MAG TPA: ABC transporter substrate-binding protein [Methylomirabilota bacterium]|nr:ABC transporter substrate-binding protein [Methylomirabilota bacterium]